MESENFTPHPDKLRIMRKDRQQEATGLTVNQRPAVPREKQRRFRALLHQVEKEGLRGRHRDKCGAHLMATIHGYACFIHMVDPEKGKPLMAKARELAMRHGWKPPLRPEKKVAEPVKAKKEADGKPESSVWQKLMFWKK